MIPVKVMALRKGDTFRFDELSEETYTIVDRHGSTAAGFVTLELAELLNNMVTVPVSTTLFAMRMYRPVKVPCLVHREEVELLYDLASGGTPRAVLCGECDERVTAEVLKQTADLRASREEGE